MLRFAGAPNFQFGPTELIFPIAGGSVGIVTFQWLFDYMQLSEWGL